MPVVSSGLSRNCLEYFGWSGVSVRDAGFAGAMIDIDSGEVGGIMARICRGLASDVFTLALCRLFACWPVLTVSNCCGCSDCSKFRWYPGHHGLSQSCYRLGGEEVCECQWFPRV